MRRGQTLASADHRQMGYLTPSDIPVGTMFANLDPANGLSGRTVKAGVRAISPLTTASEQCFA